MSGQFGALFYYAFFFFNHESFSIERMSESSALLEIPEYYVYVAEM